MSDPSLKTVRPVSSLGDLGFSLLDFFFLTWGRGGQGTDRDLGVTTQVVTI